MPNNRWLLPLLLAALLLALLFPLAACERTGSEPEKRFKIRPDELPPITAQYARETAARLEREWNDPEFRKALELYAHKQYDKAAQAMLPLAEGGNSMAMRYYATCRWVRHGFDAFEKSTEWLFKAAAQGNPYAMMDLNREIVMAGVSPVFTIRSGEDWQGRAFEYWKLLMARGDPEAEFCLTVSGQNEKGLFALIYKGYEPAVIHLGDVYEEVVRDRKDFWQEYPDWPEVALAHIKRLADAGNPMSQFHYATITGDEGYLEISADNAYRPALHKLSQKNINNSVISKEDILKALYRRLQSTRLRGSILSYDTNASSLKYGVTYHYKTIAEEEFNEQARRAEEWHKTHPYPYRYIHPYMNMD